MRNFSLTNNYNVPIENKVNEDLELINLIETFFIKKRGYVVKMPPPGTPVCVCMSGGMDSVSTIAVLMDYYKLKIYPFFINRGQSNLKWEKESIYFYDKLFAKRYPKLFNKTFEIEVDIPSKSYKKNIVAELKDNHIGYPARNSIIFLSGAEYAYSLKKEGIEIQTIFGATVVSDSLFHSSLTWTRVTNLSICQFLNDYRWQMMSLAIEKELGNSYDKDVLINYCKKINIPLEYTRTCVGNTEKQCGKCICCYDRRRCFKEANVEDKTDYLFN